ncbi:hypothetical protein ACP70R_032159 [Stipagrostis hirtigluma subsp. patula]
MGCRNKTRMPAAALMLLAMVMLLATTAAARPTPDPQPSPSPPPPTNLELYKRRPAAGKAGSSWAVTKVSSMAADTEKLAGTPPAPASSVEWRALAKVKVIPPSGPSQCGNRYNPWSPSCRCGCLPGHA